MIDNQFIESVAQQAIRSIEQRQSTEFDCLYTIKNFLIDQAISKLKNYLPATTDQQWTTVANQEHCNRRKLTWDSDTVIEELHLACDLLTPTISKIAGTSLNFLGLQIWKDWSGYLITPHQDNPIIDASMQLYLFDNSPNLGTTFSDDITKIEIPYVNNSGYLFFSKNVGNIKHSTTNITPANATRYSLYLVWSRTTKL
jgi:hypothetical protein